MSNSVATMTMPETALSLMMETAQGPAFVFANDGVLLFEALDDIMAGQDQARNDIGKETRITRVRLSEIASSFRFALYKPALGKAVRLELKSGA